MTEINRVTTIAVYRGDREQIVKEALGIANPLASVYEISVVKRQELHLDVPRLFLPVSVDNSDFMDTNIISTPDIPDVGNLIAALKDGKGFQLKDKDLDHFLKAIDCKVKFGSEASFVRYKGRVVTVDKYNDLKLKERNRKISSPARLVRSWLEIFIVQGADEHSSEGFTPPKRKHGRTRKNVGKGNQDEEVVFEMELSDDEESAETGKMTLRPKRPHTFVEEYSDSISIASIDETDIIAAVLDPRTISLFDVGGGKALVPPKRGRGRPKKKPFPYLDVDTPRGYALYPPSPKRKCSQETVNAEMEAVMAANSIEDEMNARPKLRRLYFTLNDVYEHFLELDRVEAVNNNDMDTMNLKVYLAEWLIEEFVRPQVIDYQSGVDLEAAGPSGLN